MGYNDDYAAGKRAAERQAATQEYAIQDEATGEWWTGARWRKEGPDGCVWSRYVNAVAYLAPVWNPENARETARIVPAPPREMTDEECWTWFKDNCLLLGNMAGQWLIWDKADVAYTPCGSAGSTPCDAIRAARKALESR